MSREYFARIEMGDINKYHGGFDLNSIDKIWKTLINNCGFSQILKVSEHFNDSDHLVDYTAEIIMGCSGGTGVQGSLDELIKQLDKNSGVKVSSARVWSLHGDRVDAEYDG